MREECVFKIVDLSEPAMTECLHGNPGDKLGICRSVKKIHLREIVQNVITKDRTAQSHWTRRKRRTAQKEHVVRSTNTKACYEGKRKKSVEGLDALWRVLSASSGAWILWETFSQEYVIGCLEDDRNAG